MYTFVCAMQFLKLVLFVSMFSIYLFPLHQSSSWIILLLYAFFDSMVNLFFSVLMVARQISFRSPLAAHSSQVSKSHKWSATNSFCYLCLYTRNFLIPIFPIRPSTLHLICDDFFYWMSKRLHHMCLSSVQVIL